MTSSSDTGLPCGRGQDSSNIASAGGRNLPIVMAAGCRMPRSPSRDKDFASCSRSTASSPQQQPFGGMNRTPGAAQYTAEAFFKRKSQDVSKSGWFEEENYLIKSCGALQSALGLSKSFSTSDITDVPNVESDYWPTDNEDIRMPNSYSEIAINKLGIDSNALLMATTMQGRLGNTSRSLSTCVVVGDMASTSQLPSPSRYTCSSVQSNSIPPAFSSTDLVRSVNKKVRQNYIQRRLLVTYKTLERLSQSEFNLDKTARNNMVLDQQLKSLGLNGSGAASPVAVGASRFLSVPRTGGNPLCPDDVTVCTDTIKQYQSRAFTRHDRNMFIVNWLDNIDPQNCTTPEDL